jgi:hypothetical protein
MTEPPSTSAAPPDPQAPALVVVVPARDAGDTIGHCLGALLAAGFRPQEITVVDDGSRDGTGAIAAAAGVRVVRNPDALGPACARNGGATAAGGEAILFVDADVRVHADVRARLLDHLSRSEVTAVIGAYDEDPLSRSVVGRYRNLLHTYSHRQSAGDVPTFWTGLGAIRRQAFEDAGGFRSEWQSIEDVELGLKVTARGGRIRLDPLIAGQHLKDWTVRSMFRTDLAGRAVPWTRLLRSGRMPMGVLATSPEKRLSAAAVALFIASLLIGLVWLPALAVAVPAAVVFAAANAGLIAFLARIEGPWFALAALPFHAIHHLAGLLGYARVVLLERR